MDGHDAGSCRLHRRAAAPSAPTNRGAIDDAAPASASCEDRPGAATNLAVQASGGGTRLSWTAASDDRGTRGYNVYREGSYIATVKLTLYDDVQRWSPTTTRVATV